MKVKGDGWMSSQDAAKGWIFQDAFERKAERRTWEPVLPFVCACVCVSREQSRAKLSWRIGE